MQNRYHALLAGYISNSGLSLREIAVHCEERGQKIAPSYISKLQNGHLPPPSEAISIVLAEVLGCNPDILVYCGYVEKAPKIVQQILPTNYAEIPINIFTLIERISKLPPRFREKIYYELEWLELLNTDQLQ